MTEPVEPDLPDLCWPIDDDCLPDSWADYPDDVKAKAIALATATLYRLTLGLVGGCPITVRPCGSEPVCGPQYPWQAPWMQPTLLSGSWVNCAHGSGCPCAAGCEVWLPGYVGPVDEIKVNGTEVTDFKVFDHASIVYTGDDDCPFPKRQNLALPDTEADTFSITYLPARPVDGLAAWAAGTLAGEYAKSCSGSKCRLPSNVTSIVRQGVSLDLITGVFPDGFTGIREVDAFIALWNPDGNKARAVTRVWSPDMDRVRVES